MRSSRCASVLFTVTASSVALGEASYSTNIGAAFFVPTGTVQFNGVNTTSPFPLLGISNASAASTRSPGSGGHESFISSVDRGLIEHTSSGSGTRTLLTNTSNYEGLTFAGSGSSSATWSDVVVSYVGGDIGSDTIAVSAAFSVIAGAFATGTNVQSAGYNITASASIAGAGGSFGLHVQGSSGSGQVFVPPVFVTVNQPFTVSMALQTARSPSGVAFGGFYPSAPGGAAWEMFASIATNGPSFSEPAVFNVPEGYTVNSPSMGVVNNRWTGRTVFPPCGPADIGKQGGVEGADGALDNNDFVVYIDRFFAQAVSADVGIQGGIAGHDGAFDNNDFIVFIDRFFAGC
jgi:hypothetical protein